MKNAVSVSLLAILPAITLCFSFEALSVGFSVRLSVHPSVRLSIREERPSWLLPRITLLRKFRR